MSATDESSATGNYPTADYTTPIEAVYMAVAEASERDPLDLPPIAEAVDVDALNNLIDGGSESVSLSFEYAGWEITITGEAVHVDEI